MLSGANCRQPSSTPAARWGTASSAGSAARLYIRSTGTPSTEARRSIRWAEMPVRPFSTALTVAGLTSSSAASSRRVMPRAVRSRRTVRPKSSREGAAGSDGDVMGGTSSPRWLSRRRRPTILAGVGLASPMFSKPDHRLSATIDL